MSISPGKFGELIKALLVKSKYPISNAFTVAVVLTERIIEFLALLIMVIIGINILEFDCLYLIITLISLVLLGLFLRNKRFTTVLKKIFFKLPFVNKNTDAIEDFNSSLTQLFVSDIFIKGLFISLIAWFFEFIAFYKILSILSLNVEILYSSFLYSLSIIAGALSMLPGGIGSTEVSLTFLLTQDGISSSSAIASTILIRVVTLWFSVVIGFIAFLIYAGKNKIVKNLWEST